MDTPTDLHRLLVAEGSPGLPWSRVQQQLAALKPTLEQATVPVSTSVDDADEHAGPEWSKHCALDAPGRVYNAASIAFCLLMGEPPFAAGTAAARRVRQMLERLPALPEAVPAAVRQSLIAALHPLPEDRPRSLEALYTLWGLPPDHTAPRSSRRATPLPPEPPPTSFKATGSGQTGAFPESRPTPVGSPREESMAAMAAPLPMSRSIAAPTVFEAVPVPAPRRLRRVMGLGLLSLMVACAGLTIGLGLSTLWRPAAVPTANETDAISEEESETTPMQEPVPVPKKKGSEPMPPEEASPQSRGLLMAAMVLFILGLPLVLLVATGCLLWILRARSPARAAPDPTQPTLTPIPHRPAQPSLFELGNYRCLEKLGEGGMGMVYVAEHQRLGRRCAIKVLSPSMAVRDIALAMFQREARLTAQINHPNVVTVYDFGQTTEALFYLVMELVEGTSLEALSLPLSVPRVLDITRQLCAGLDAAHAAGILHRDLKPANILIARHPSGRDLVKIVDFGISRPIAQSEVSLMGADVVVGTPAWMSPEQARGEPHLDARSDIFSMGLIIYSLLTGQPPFQSDSQMPLQRLYERGHLAQRPQPPSIHHHIPPGLDQALLQALDPEPSQRPASAGAFYVALAASLP